MGPLQLISVTSKATIELAALQITVKNVLIVLIVCLFATGGMLCLYSMNLCKNILYICHYLILHSTSMHNIRC